MSGAGHQALYLGLKRSEVLIFVVLEASSRVSRFYSSSIDVGVCKRPRPDILRASALASLLLFEYSVLVFSFGCASRRQRWWRHSCRTTVHLHEFSFTLHRAWFWSMDTEVHDFGTTRPHTFLSMSCIVS